MSFWKRLFGGDDPPKTVPGGDSRDAMPPGAASHGSKFNQEQHDDRDADAPIATAAVVTRLRRTGQPGGATVAEALAQLRAARGARQGQLLAAALDALDAVDSGDTGVDALRIMCASMLSERGSMTRASAVLRHCRDPHGLLLAADLHAAAGDLGRALSAIERVLARDVDIAGASERHARWSALLGRTPPPTAPAMATVVAPHSHDNNAYRLLREVSRGGAGTVYEAQDAALGRRVAYKVYHRSEHHRPQLLREARATASLYGPGVIQLFDCDADEGWIAYEWAAGGSLAERLRGARVQQLLPLLDWLPPLVRALIRVHRRGLAHGDIKPHNVLFRHTGEPLLSDFGLCHRNGERVHGGTPGYLSPERLQGNTVSFGDDIYALGRIFEDVLDATKGLHHNAATAPQRQLLTSLVWRCLGNADQRPSAPQLLRALAAKAGGASLQQARDLVR